MGVSSEQSSNNMNRFVVAFAFVACVSGAPQYLNHGVSTVGHASYAGPAQHVGVSHGPTVAHGGPVASAPVVTGQTHQTYAAGPAVVEQHTEYGVVGSQVVQTGHASVIGGYTHVPAGQEVIPQPANSYVAGAPQTLVQTRALPAPVIPHAAPYLAAIPPAPVPAGFAPADTVVQQKILAPVRTHTRITPSTFPCTLSRPTSSPELPTLRPPPSPTWPPPLLLMLPALLPTALSAMLPTPPLASSDTPDTSLELTKWSKTTNSTSRLCNPKTSIYLFMFGNCSLFRRLIFR